MKFIIGKKLNMSQVFGEDGYATPVTAIQMEPMAVIRTKTSDTDGYTATVVGYGVQKESRINKAQRSVGNFRGTMEIRSDNPSLGGFEPGETVTVSGITKGKGFQGVVKRHGFHGGSRTHGQKHSEREVGSIGGAGRAGGRVSKGMRMAGRMGTDRVTVRNLKVVKVDDKSGIIFVRGAVPGRRGTLLEIKAI
ncbi:MAG TPA: 50S ribosomal protein L3 [Candidatus Paceibacterota bacterium]